MAEEGREGGRIELDVSSTHMLVRGRRLVTLPVANRTIITAFAL